MKEIKNLLLIILIVCCMAGCVAMLLIPGNPPADTSSVSKDKQEAIDQEPIVVYKEKIVEKEVEKVITGEILAEGLQDMGLLITQEYYFTEAIDYSTTRRFLGTDFKLPGTESSFLMSYDGVIKAGVEFGEISVTKDDEAKKIMIVLPKAKLCQTTVDPDSFKEYYSKQSIFNMHSPEDYNEALKQLEKNAETRALERGILDKADENARNVISNFVSSLIDTSEYQIQFSTRR